MLYNLHTHKASGDPGVLEIVNQYPNELDPSVAFYSIGIHPWYAQADRLEDDLRIISEKLKEANCLALGECGLDKRIETDINKQLSVFERQLELLEHNPKPVILHCVAAYQEVIAVKKQMKVEVPMIIHGFSKNYQVARSLLDNGFYLSFGKYLLRNPELESVFKAVPDDRFFLETDMVEETIFQVYKKAASIKSGAIEEMVAQNFKNVFDNNK